MMSHQPILCLLLTAVTVLSSCLDEQDFHSPEQPETPSVPTVPEGNYFADSLEYTPEKQRQTLTDIQRGYFRFFYENCQADSKMALIGIKTTIIAIKLLILRSFQRKGLCNSGLKAKSTTFEC